MSTQDSNAVHLDRGQDPGPQLDLNPTRLNKPAFLMNVPFSFNARSANNAWMKDLSDKDRAIDQAKATRQFMELYHFVSAEGLVYLLPTPASCRLQDLVFTANMGIVLEHLPDKNTAVISRFATAPRIGETDVGINFFSAMGYDTEIAPYTFEGEADLKHLYDNVYIGGYGMRSDIRTFEWMERTYDMKIIKVCEVDPYLYHLDTLIFPITPEDTIVCTELFEAHEVAELEKHTNVIPVTADEAYSGITNSVRLYNTVLNGSNLNHLKAGTEDYRFELAKNRRLEDIACELGFEVSYFNISEFMKGGALLSCMMMHLNRRSYEISLL